MQIPNSRNVCPLAFWQFWMSVLPCQRKHQIYTIQYNSRSVVKLFLNEILFSCNNIYRFGSSPDDLGHVWIISDESGWLRALFRNYQTPSRSDFGIVWYLPITNNYAVRWMQRYKLFSLGRLLSLANQLLRLLALYKAQCNTLFCYILPFANRACNTLRWVSNTKECTRNIHICYRFHVS